MRTQPTPVENILQVCVTGMLEKGQSMEFCLAQYPGQSSELEPLLRLTSRLQAARNLQASPDFRMSSPARMKALIASSRRIPQGQAPVPAYSDNPFVPVLRGLNRYWARPASRQLAYARVLTAVFILMLFVFSVATVQASALALPGDRLYGFKTGMEVIRLKFAWRVFQDAELHMEYANTRIQETARLREQERDSWDGEALQQYDDEINILKGYYLPSTPLTMDERTMLAGELLKMLAVQEKQMTTWLSDGTPGFQQALQVSLSSNREMVRIIMKHLEMISGHPIQLTATPSVVTTPPATTPVIPTMGVPVLQPTALPDPSPVGVIPGMTTTPFPWDLWKWATPYVPVGQGTYLPPPLPTNWQDYIPTYLPTVLPTLLPGIIHTPVVSTPPAGWPTQWEEFPTPAWPTDFPDPGDDNNPPPWVPPITPPDPPSIPFP